MSTKKRNVTMSKFTKLGMLFGVTGIMTSVTYATNNVKAAEASSSVASSDSSTLPKETQSSVNSSLSSSTAKVVSSKNDSSTSESIKNTNETTEETALSTTVLKQDANMGQGYYATTNNIFARSLLRTNTQAFLDSIHQGSINGWNKYGVLPSTVAAQAILESGWGASSLTTLANNLFGIKGNYNGASIIMPTQEYINGQWITINASFRKYPSRNESIEDHGRFLNDNSRYHNLLWQTDYRTVTQLLQSDGYATSPTYAASLNRIIEEYHLYDWDNEVINVNTGAMDNLSVRGSNLSISGWHISSNSNNKPYSYLILLDANSNKEISRIKINRTQRADVNNVFPSVANSLNSGFNVQVPTSDDMMGKKIKVISRYSSSADGNGSFSDYNFTNVVGMPVTSAGSLDVINQNQLDRIQLSGWFATDAAVNKPYRYVILLDTATNKELGRYQVQSLARPDVANVYPNIANVMNSGYNVAIPLTSQLLGKQVRVITRYSDNAQGNGNFVDYWNDGKTFQTRDNQNKGWLDVFKQSGNKIHAMGWHITDSSLDKKNHYLIILDSNNKELGRYKVPTIARPDVARVYSTIYGAQNGGIDYEIPVTSAMKGKAIHVISRYTNDAQGNGEFTDYWFPNQINKIN